MSDDKKIIFGVVGSPSDSFEATIDINEVNEESKLLGELAYFEVKEGDNTVLVLGQITEIETRNRWHEEFSFKGIIKRHGRLPNLSGVADNRIAKINVQSSFIQKEDRAEAHKLANSPSTGMEVRRVSNEIMGGLMKQYEGKLVCFGTAYDTLIDIPFRFKHFGSSKDGGSGDAYHIGIFGRTGSGKTVTAANMILGYAQHHDYMSILILDPQEQFYHDNNVLPPNKESQEKRSFIKEIEGTGMKCEKYKIPTDVALPNDANLFSELLLNHNFIKDAFGILSEDKAELMRDAIESYINGRMNDPRFKIGSDSERLFKDLLNYFLKEEKKESAPLGLVYSQKQYIDRIKIKINDVLNGSNRGAKSTWNKVSSLFSEKDKKTSFRQLIKGIIEGENKVVILNISGREAPSGMEDLQARYVQLIEEAVKEKGRELYANEKQANCLVVLDEAHRFINKDSSEKIKELTKSIIDSVRTTRKYGIGHMFITQTLESLDEEIRQQMRIFAFGYGLTSGTEYRKVKDIINDDAGAKFYRSFIDPASNNKFPFMFYGPISPLSFTGTPLFLEMKGLLHKFPKT